jgi:hypothetical protein
MFAPCTPIARPMNSMATSNSILNGVAINYLKIDRIRRKMDY